MPYSSREILGMTPVVPVIVITDLGQAVPLANALIEGGIKVLEVTLRTPEGLQAITQIKEQVEGAVVGAGTIVNESDLEQALEAGSEFIITPGLTDSLLRKGSDCGVPFMPGIATVSEMMRCLDHGLNTLKFFPAEANGGAPALKAISGPFPDVRFCPTGGINQENLKSYLSLPSVLSVGGSWMVPQALIEKGDWAGITQLATEAGELVAAIREKLK